MRPLGDTGCVCVAFVIQNDSRSDMFPFKSLRVFTLLCSNIHLTTYTCGVPGPSSKVRNTQQSSTACKAGSREQRQNKICVNFQNKKTPCLGQIGFSCAERTRSFKMHFKKKLSLMHKNNGITHRSHTQIYRKKYWMGKSVAVFEWHIPAPSSIRMTYVYIGYIIHR